MMIKIMIMMKIILKKRLVVLPYMESIHGRRSGRWVLTKGIKASLVLERKVNAFFTSKETSM